MARTGKLLGDHYQPMLKAAKVPCIVLEKKNDPGEPGVRLATMHRVKGLEFPVMLLAGVNAGVVPMRVVLRGRRSRPPEPNTRSENGPCCSWRRPGPGIT